MTGTHSRLVAGVCPIVLALLTGCQHTDEPPPVTPAVYAAPAVVVTAPAPLPVPPPEVTAVRVAPGILEACGIDDAPAGPAPLFAFDSATLSQGDQRLLGQVARCLTSGPLVGRALKLVGRADPRGTEAYNVSLGDRRASGVGSYLEQQGMAAAKLSQTSRGALDATGTDESGWINDRRVDVDLVAEEVAALP